MQAPVFWDTYSYIIIIPNINSPYSYYTYYNNLCMIYSSYYKRSSLTESIITSGKNFIKITSVGMGAAKSNETR